MELDGRVTADEAVQGNVAYLNMAVVIEDKKNIPMEAMGDFIDVIHGALDSKLEGCGDLLSKTYDHSPEKFSLKPAFSEFALTDIAVYPKGVDWGSESNGMGMRDYLKVRNPDLPDDFSPEVAYFIEVKVENVFRNADVATFQVFLDEVIGDAFKKVHEEVTGDSVRKYSTPVDINDEPLEGGIEDVLGVMYEEDVDKLPGFTKLNQE